MICMFKYIYIHIYIEVYIFYGNIHYIPYYLPLLVHVFFGLSPVGMSTVITLKCRFSSCIDSWDV